MKRKILPVCILAIALLVYGGTAFAAETNGELPPPPAVEEPVEAQTSTPIATTSQPEIPVTQLDEPENEPSPRHCRAAEELFAELEKDIGGEIYLDSDGPFVITGNEYGYGQIYVSQPVTVNLPPQGLVFNDVTFFRISGPVTFKGTVGLVFPCNVFLTFEGGATVDVCEAEIEGRTKPPVGIELQNGGWVDGDGSICAEGENALGINAQGSDEKVYLRRINVTAKGSAATAVAGNGSLLLSHGSLKAEGVDAYAIRQQGLVEMQLTKVEGPVSGTRFRAAVSWFSHPPEGLETAPVSPYSQPKDSMMVYQNLAYGSQEVYLPETMPVYYEFTPTDPTNESFFSGLNFTFTADWDLHELDYATPGTYTATAQLTPVTPMAEWADVLPVPIPAVTQQIKVMPANRAAICRDSGQGASGAVQLLAPIPEAQKILFWVYDNQWKELTATGNALYAEEWNEQLLVDYEWASYPLFYVTGLENDTKYSVVVQVVGGPMAGFSNIFTMWYSHDGGGDRTGTDRETPTSLPPDSSSETQSHPSDNSSSSRPNSSSSSSNSNSSSSSSPSSSSTSSAPPASSSSQSGGSVSASSTPIRNSSNTSGPPQNTGNTLTTIGARNAPGVLPVAEVAGPKEKDEMAQPLEEQLTAPGTTTAKEKEAPPKPQAANQPQFPFTILIVLFAGIAALASGALLVLRLKPKFKGPHGKG